MDHFIKIIQIWFNATSIVLPDNKVHWANMQIGIWELLTILEYDLSIIKLHFAANTDFQSFIMNC